MNLMDTFPRGKGKDKIQNSCNRPFRTVTISNDGECYICVCQAWLPISVGNIESFDRLEDIWSNPIATELQQDIVEKKFTNCAVEHCGILYDDIYHPTYRINVALDNSCNLSCPSCRRDMINLTQGEEFDERSKRVNHFLKLLQKFTAPMTIVLIGNGDPLASTIMRPLVLNWNPNDSQKVILFTNGLLMKKLLPESNILPNIWEFWISVDAGSKEVYEQVRRPGKYDVLRENLDWLVENKPDTALVTLKFTVSSSNAADIENFCSLCNHYGFEGEITKLDDWGTFDNFSSHEVIDNTKHLMHNIAIEQLKSVSKNPHMHLSPYFKKLL